MNQLSFEGVFLNASPQMRTPDISVVTWVTPWEPLEKFYLLCFFSLPSDPTRARAFRCNGHACNPSVGNLAAGRTPVTTTTCGQNSTELFCFYPEQNLLHHLSPGCGQPRCSKCNTNQPDNSHLPADMTDDFFANPISWWQSAQGVHREEIRLDFETEFYLTHVIAVFKSPRPAAMVLERSQDYGQTWRPYKYFSVNCTATFGLQDDLIEEGSMCTSRYSDAVPCTRGEVSTNWGFG